MFSEQIEKWKHGPVVPEVYHLYKDNGSCAIPNPTQIDLSIFTEEEIELMDEVYQVYGQFSAFALSDLTHNELPWLNSQYSEEIDRTKMKDYFRTQIIKD